MKSRGNLFRKIRDSRNTRNFLVFLVFVVIAAVFWFIMALNEEMQDTVEVKVNIVDKPDSVTFVTIPPAKILVSVKDRGSHLMRANLFKNMELNLNFREYSDGDVFRVSSNALHGEVRHLFGQNAVISAVMPDSIRLYFSRHRGVWVPVRVIADVTAEAGMAVVGEPKISTPRVMLFTIGEEDSVTQVYTRKIVIKHLSQATTVSVPIEPVAGARVEPSTVDVTFNVEPLVKKESEVPVTVDNKPEGKDILFFPSKARVLYYVPMSNYNGSSEDLKVVASFREAELAKTNKVALRIASKAPYMKNVELLTDSVEYTLVKQ